MSDNWRIRIQPREPEHGETLLERLGLDLGSDEAKRLAEEGIEAGVEVERWVAEEERWSGEAPQESWEQDELARNHAPWEVRVELPSHDEADQLADQLESEGYDVVRRWRYLIVGAASEEDAKALAQRVHGEAEPGGQVVWEVTPQNPFAVFGGLGG